MTLHFRKIQNEDFLPCGNILVAAYKEEPWNNSWSLEEAKLRIEATMSGFNARGFIIEKEEQIIAMCLGRIDYYYDNWSQFCIDEFNIIPSHQGKGIGKNLLHFVSEQLRQENVHRLFLLTGGEQAASFYQKNGFEEEKEGIMLAYDLQAKPPL